MHWNIKSITIFSVQHSFLWPLVLPSLRWQVNTVDLCNKNALFLAPSALGRARSIRRSDPSHPILPAAREICRSCFENPHLDFGNRVLSRVYEKRPDFQKFVQSVGKDKWPMLTNNFQNYIEEVINNIENLDAIQRFSKQYGEEHVPFKSYGFKPDYWVSVAEAILVECTILGKLLVLN